jgi:hypothetical protein
MNRKHIQWILVSCGLAVSVGCTVPFLVNTKDNTGTANSPVGIPSSLASSLPVFLPQPGAPNGPITLPSPQGPFGAIASANPGIDGPLPTATPTPFLPNLPPDIDNQISANPLPIIQASGQLTTTLPIIKSIIKGKVLGWNIKNERFEPLANARVKVDESLSLSTDANGFYATTQEFDKLVSISAGFEGYTASSVTDVPPGTNRDIHLNPLAEGPLYRQEAFSFKGSVTNLNQNGKDSFVVFADANQSKAAAATPDKFTGRYNMEVRVKANRASTQGTLFTGVYESVGSLLQLTQYGYSPNVAVPTPPPIPVPTATPETETGAAVPLKATELVLSFNHLISPEAFGQINVNLTAPSDSGLSNAVMHVYINMPDGGRVLVAKYTNNASATVTQVVRVPKLANTTFTLEAHSGTSLKGSDIIVPNIQINNTVTRSFLPAPIFNRIGDETDFKDLNKTHFTTSDLTPTIAWNKQTSVNSYQLDIQGETPQTFRWEAYTLGSELTYPDFGTDHPSSLKLGKTYRVQLMASDFDIGTFNVLSSRPDWESPSRVERIVAGQNAPAFSVQLLNPTIRNFAQGYRVSYSTLSFLSN